MRRALTALACLCFWIAAGGAAAATPVWFDWIASRDGAHPTYYAGGLTLELGSKRLHEGPPTPTLTIQAPGRKPLTLTGEQAFDDPAALVGVVSLDQKSSARQVLFMTYSGGAHCCTTVEVAMPIAGGWRRRELSYDGDPQKGVYGEPIPGIGALVLDDGNFDYTFASHAGSRAAQRLYVDQAGQLMDVSSEPRFAAFHRQQAADDLKTCRTGVERNGGCAAYVAEEALVGDYNGAWRTMLATYDAHALPWWPTGCRTLADPCPKAEVLTFKDFPHALDWFLWRYGYHPLAPDFVCTLPNCPAPTIGPFRP